MSRQYFADRGDQGGVGGVLGEVSIASGVEGKGRGCGTTGYRRGRVKVAEDEAREDCRVGTVTGGKDGSRGPSNAAGWTSALASCACRLSHQVCPSASASTSFCICKGLLSPTARLIVRTSIRPGPTSTSPHFHLLRRTDEEGPLRRRLPPPRPLPL